MIFYINYIQIKKNKDEKNFMQKKLNKSIYMVIRIS